MHDGKQRIVVTQNDVRQIQLAKAALYAGVKLLLDRAGIEKVDRIRLAGAFGSHIDPKHAMVLGLVPDCDPDKVASAGNAAGTGARIALLNVGARREIEDIAEDLLSLYARRETVRRAQARIAAEQARLAHLAVDGRVRMLAPEGVAGARVQVTLGKLSRAVAHLALFHGELPLDVEGILPGYAFHRKVNPI